MASYLYPHSGPACVFCDRPADQHCSRCKVSYCSVACQTDDWCYHRWMCKPLVEKYDPKYRPTSNHSLVIILPKRSAKPKFHWLNPDVPGTFEQFFKYLPTQHQFVQSLAMIPEIRRSNHEERAAACEELVLLSTDQRDRGNLLPYNKTVLSMSQYPGWVFPWRGPLMLCRWGWKGQTEPPMNTTHVPIGQNWRDMTYYDFRRGVDFFCWYRANAATSWPDRVPASLDFLVDAVKLNCCQDNSNPTLNLPIIESVILRGITLELDDKWYPLPATQRLGLPLLYRNVYCLSHVRGQMPRETVPLALINDAASFLMMERPAEKDGNITLNRALQLGSIVVVREDRGLLLTIHLSVIYQFLRWCLIGRMDPSADDSPILDQPLVFFNAEEYYQTNTKEAFAAHWAKVTAEARQEDPTIPESPFALKAEPAS